MRSPNINSQIIQQQRLVKFKDLYSYLLKAHPKLAGEISQAYINTMRWYYTSHFTRYLQALDKVKVYPPDRNEVLGGDPSTHRTGENPGDHVSLVCINISQVISFLAAELALSHMTPSLWADELIFSALEISKLYLLTWLRRITLTMESKSPSETSTLHWWTTFAPNTLS